MNVSVKSIVGQTLKEGFGKITEAFFSEEKGRFLGVKTDQKKFLSADQLVFEDDDIQIVSKNKKAESGKNWIGYQVFSENKKNDFGEITDIEFDPNMSIIKRIMVTKSVFGLPFSQHIFPYERIVDVKEKTVYIDTDTKQKDAEYVPAM
jgi:uncharacterized protein YrrD